MNYTPQILRFISVAAITTCIAFFSYHPAHANSARGRDQLRKVGRFKTLVTAYCPCRKCCGRDANGVTSTGRNAFRYQGVAADPKAIPYGRYVRIPGVGFRKVDDTGGAMRQSWRKKGIVHLDLRFRQHKDALNWGRRWMFVDVFTRN